MALSFLSDCRLRHGGRRYGIDYTDGDQFLGIPQITRFSDFMLRPNDTFFYLYDYYDNGVDQIRIEAIKPDDGS